MREQSERIGKILLLTNMLPPLVGGTAVVYDKIAENLSGDVEVITARTHPVDGREIEGYRESDASRSYRIHRLRYLRPPLGLALRRLLWKSDFLLIDVPVMLWTLWSVTLIARRTGATVLCIGELWGLGWLALMLKYLTRRKVIIYTHGEEVTQAGWTIWARLRKPALRAADAVVTVSTFTRDILVHDIGLDPKKVIVIPNGVDLSRFKPSPDASTEAAVERGPRFILAAGRHIERKGFDHLIEAMPKIIRRFPETKLIIAGDGPIRPKLEARVADLGMADRVDFVGPVDDGTLLSLYQRCHFFVMPNRTMPDGDTEGFGLVFLEANACGKPVVGGRAGGVPDAIQCGESGLLIDGNDIEAIAGAVCRLLDDTAFYTHCARGALRRAQASSWSVSANRFRAACRMIQQDTLLT